MILNENLLHRAAFVGASASENARASDQTLSKARFLFFSGLSFCFSKERPVAVSKPSWVCTERGFLNFTFKPAETRQSVDTGENATKENVSLPF